MSFTTTIKKSESARRRNAMAIVHVSGSPGSGKTTLGERIARDFAGQVTVFDTDEIIQHHLASGKELVKLMDDTSDKGLLSYTRRWTEIFTEGIDDVIARTDTKVLVFVGILNHFRPPGGSILALDAATERFFIDLPLSQLVRQFYTRYGKELGQDQEFWTGIVEQRYNIPDSLSFVRDSKQEREWHAAHDYKFLGTEDIYEAIGRLVLGENRRAITELN